MRVRAGAECATQAARRLDEGIGAGSDAGLSPGLTKEIVFFSPIMEENIRGARGFVVLGDHFSWIEAWQDRV